MSITRPLKLVPSEAICLDDNQPAVASGVYACSNSDYWTGSEGCFLVNLADVIHLGYHPDKRRHNGCCGRDGCDGPNRICLNGHEIGTERSDCWMAHAIVLVPTIGWREHLEL